MEIMRSSWDLSYLLDLQEASIMFRRMKMSLHLHIVAHFRDGLINLVDITSSNIPCMIKVADILSNRISSLPPISMNFISFHDYISIYSHDHYMLDLYLLFYKSKHRGRYFDGMINWLHWLYDFT
jgi:hypothetical protein